MPSWPTRLFSGSSTSNQASNHGTRSNESASQEDRLRGATRPQTPLRSLPFPTFNNSHGTSIPRRVSQHGRSVSHPFPSVFGSGKKQNSREDDDGIVVDAKTLHFGSPGSQVPDQPGFSRLSSANNNELELTSGKCATCDSHVRWPRHLDVFRCTVCLMVNDQKINYPKATADDGFVEAPADSSGKRVDTCSPARIPHLSLQRTQALLDQCISLYLQHRFGLPESTNVDDSDLLLEQWSEIPNDRTSPHQQGVMSPEIVQAANTVDTGTMIQPGAHGPNSSRGYKTPIDERAMSLPSSPSERLQPTGPTKVGRTIAQPPQSANRPPPLPPATTLRPPQGFKPLTTRRSRSDSSKSIFRSLENYIIACFNGMECLNGSFLLAAPPSPVRAKSDGAVPALAVSPTHHVTDTHSMALSPLDAKTLLLGDFAENGMWWAGGARTERSSSQRVGSASLEGTSGERISMKSPRINWKELHEWYKTILTAGRSWRRSLNSSKLGKSSSLSERMRNDEGLQQQIDDDFRDASSHLQRTLLKATENLLRRPGRPLKKASECRFLLILLANPLLYPQGPEYSIWPIRTSEELSPNKNKDSTHLQPQAVSSVQGPTISRPSSARHKSGNLTSYSGITKRILGLLANLPGECHQRLVAWLSRFTEARLRKLVDLVGSFVTYRLSRQHGRKRSQSHDSNGGLVPSLSDAGMSSSAQLHAALGITSSQKSPEDKADTVVYSEDWQIKAAARVMSLLFSANNSADLRPHHMNEQDADTESTSPMSVAHHRASKYGQVLPTSAFYNTLLDYSDLIADFETWESRKGKFSFCQYPMFLSIWAKIRIMEHDARRQMEIKAREAFFDSIMNRKAVSQFLVLKVRRDCLVEDSLRGVSEVVGTGQEEIKKGLRIEFLNEEGIDAGGLRKEWFLMLVREVFDPEHGLFVYDEDSHYCYFNPNTFETSDQFFLVGVVLGLALYNSTMLDVALPPFVFRKLLASAPAYAGPVTSSVRPVAGYTLDDLAEFRPSLAKGLRQLLDFEGDVESTFYRDFVAEVDRYGQITQVPLCLNGEQRTVTNANRREFVDLYIHYLLDTAVARQYEPFKRGFFTVCAGNALSLFRPEEIELLVRGSDEPLDVATLQAVATYENWGKQSISAEEPVVQWFWEAFRSASPSNQRRLLSFITASDRIPAMGAVNLVIKIACLGDDTDRFPTARTCFNRLGLYRYPDRQQFETKLWRAVRESAGFGMK